MSGRKTCRYVNALAAIGALVSLAACGGGGDGSGGSSIGGGSGGSSTGGGSQLARSLDSAAAVSLTGAQAPQETPANQAARAPAILARIDSLIVSSMYGETSNPAYPTYAAASSCVGTSCTISFPSGRSVQVGTESIGTSTQDGRSVLTKNGITMLEYQGSGDSDYRSYEAWMDHSGFAAGTERVTENESWLTARYGIVGGDLTGSRPSGAVTWVGIMVGTPQTGAAKGNILQGDASLTFDLTNNRIDAAFTNIKNLDRRAAHPTTGVRFDDIPVAADGTYGAGARRNRIQGGFYGTGHAETAGVFEQAGIVGAFGAKKQ